MLSVQARSCSAARPSVCRPLRILHPWLDRRLDFRESPQLPSLHSASRMLSWWFVTRFHRRLQNRPCSGSSAKDPAENQARDPFFELAVAWPACAEQCISTARAAWRRGLPCVGGGCGGTGRLVSGPGSWGLSERPRLSSRTTTTGRGQRGVCCIDVRFPASLATFASAE